MTLCIANEKIKPFCEKVRPLCLLALSGLMCPDPQDKAPRHMMGISIEKSIISESLN
jgi:hypothetical protein